MSMNFKITKEEELTQFQREEVKSKKCIKQLQSGKDFLCLEFIVFEVSVLGSGISMHL